MMEFYDGEHNAEGQRHGTGVFTEIVDGWRYEGEFRNDKRHGKGIYVDSDGSSYEGDFFDDKRSWERCFDRFGRLALRR